MADLFEGLLPEGHVMWHGTPIAEAAARSDDAEETFRLALESIQRWSGRYRVSPAMRLRAIRAVVDAALSGQSV